MHSNEKQLPSRAIRAHSMKNCLAIVSAVNRLLEPSLNEAERQRLSRSQGAIERLRELIDDDLAPNGETQRRRSAEAFAAAHVLGAVRARVEDLARARNVRLSFHIGGGALSGEFHELVEALLNVVMNAIESNPSGGVVVITSRGSADGGQLWTVEDEGAGIPKYLLSRVGTPFVSRRQGGSGLGVAVARDTVERHGGRLEIQSAAGLGTLVSIHLPRQLAASPVNPRARAALAGSRADVPDAAE